MHLYQASLKRDQQDPSNLRKIRDESMREGTLPISLMSWYERRKNDRAVLHCQSSKLLDQLKSEDQGTQRQPDGNKQRFSFPFACHCLRDYWGAARVTAHRRETSIGFRHGLIIAVSYFLFIIIGDTLRGNPASSGIARLDSKCFSSSCSAHFIPATDQTIRDGQWQERSGVR